MEDITHRFLLVQVYHLCTISICRELWNNQDKNLECNSPEKSSSLESTKLTIPTKIVIPPITHEESQPQETQNSKPLVEHTKVGFVSIELKLGEHEIFSNNASQKGRPFMGHDMIMHENHFKRFFLPICHQSQLHELLRQLWIYSIPLSTLRIMCFFKGGDSVKP